MLRDTDRPSNLSWDVDLVQGVWPDQGNKLYPKPECGLYCVTHCSAKPSLGFRENSHTYLGRPNVSNSVTGVSVTPCSSLSSLKGSLSLTGTWQKSQPISTSGVSAVLLLTRKTFFLFFFFHLKSCISLPGHLALQGAPLSVFWKTQAPFGLLSPSPHADTPGANPALPSSLRFNRATAFLPLENPLLPSTDRGRLRLPRPDSQWPRNSICPPNLLSLA